MWQSRTKNDLIIEVWEMLDCENVGAVEIEAVEAVVSAEYGPDAVDSPMVIARLLADEGAELRHSEIMDLYLRRVANAPHEAALRNALKLDDLSSTLSSIRRLHNLRAKYLLENDTVGLRRVREVAMDGKSFAAEKAEMPRVGTVTRLVNLEIAQWITIWLQTPDLFEGWVDLRRRSPDFTDKFGPRGEA
jgi:hypothetical protein